MKDSKNCIKTRKIINFYFIVLLTQPNRVVQYIPLCIGDEEKKEDDEGKKEEIESEEEAYLEADAEGGAFTCNK